MNPMHKRYYFFLIAALCFVFTSCSSLALQPAAPQSNTVPGFWLGLWHGLIILFSFVASFFGDYRVYAYPNAGVWYDFGFLVGAGIFFSSGRNARHVKNRKHK